MPDDANPTLTVDAVLDFAAGGWTFHIHQPEPSGPRPDLLVLEVHLEYSDVGTGTDMPEKALHRSRPVDVEYQEVELRLVGDDDGSATLRVEHLRDPAQ